MSKTALSGCYVISLRPVGGHAAIRRAAAAHGARLLALSPWKLVARDDAQARADLQAALACDRVVFTSPMAVRAAQRLQCLAATTGQRFLAVGAGSAAALKRAGIAAVTAPERMDSEGLLALPALQDVQRLRVGLVTAPGGRDRIEPALRARGATVLRAEVYVRQPVAPAPRALAALRALQAPAWLAVSSGEALERTLAAVPSAALRVLRRARVVAASERLAALARGHGFDVAGVAASARPGDLVAAMASASMTSSRTVARP